MDLSMFYVFGIAVVLIVLFLISYKPFRVEINEYMISIPNRKIYYKWNEIKKNSITVPASQLSKPKFPLYFLATNFEDNYSYVITPKNGKMLMFNRSQVKRPHSTLKIDSVNKLIERKKTEFNL